MTRTILSVVFFVVMLVTPACSPVAETVRTFWGSSTRALEKSRPDAIRATYRCSLDECMDRVIDLSQGDLTVEPIRKKSFDIFLENRVKGVIVVMKVPGHIDTTEVGIFFILQGDRQTQVEVASLSQNAKQVVSEIVFAELERNYPVQKP